MSNSSIVWIVRQLIILFVDFLEDYCNGPGKGTRACGIYARAKSLWQHLDDLFPPLPFKDKDGD